jgi:hypothetical protein
VIREKGVKSEKLKVKRSMAEVLEAGELKDKSEKR